MSSYLDDKPHALHVEDREIDDLAKSGRLDALTNYVPGTEAERKLVRKIDVHLLPMLWVMYIMNYIDRTNIGNAKTGGMQTDLKLTSSQYSLVLSIFFVGYLLNEVPCNMILARSRPSIFLPTIMLLWGGMSIGVIGVHNLGGMVAFRFVLGLVEAGFFPGVMLIMSCWYKPAELSKRVALFYSASLMSGAFGGLLAGGIITGMEGLAGIRGWQWLFAIEGIATVCLACGAFFVLPDYPTTTRWLSPEERDLAVARLVRSEDDQNAVPLSHKQSFIAAIKDPKTYCFLIIYNMINSVSTISYFFPTLMTSLGYKGRTAQFMTVPIYVVALVFSLSIGFIADKTGKKALCAAAACVFGTISFVICATVNVSRVKYVFICFGGAGIWTTVPLALSWLVTMFEGREKRAVCIALINGFGNLASVYGSFFWPSTDAPKYHKGFAITTALMGAVSLVILAVWWTFGDKGYQYNPREERKRKNRVEAAA